MTDTRIMPTAYDPTAVEPAWYDRWLKADLFHADAGTSRPTYSIAVPPPNVTGELHMGHAVNGALQDAWARYRRMTGYEVLWLPGTDHAAIATQNVIERQLAREGMTKEQLGRPAFEERVAEWYATVGATIISQYKDLGASLDFSRLRFTMDERYVRAVRTAFVHYFDKGWLYRGPRIVNWCPHDRSAISDLEVEWEEHQDTLYSIRYPVEGSDESVVIATVRPETMLFDSGVAVHPDDDRYRHLIGRHAILPLVGRRLPIVADEAVERNFGTGALKVTPGHDPLDYEIGQRHGLELINGMHGDGTLNVPSLPQYDGKPGVEARLDVVRDLEQGGHLVSTEPYVHQVGHCDRCKHILEPLVSEQWWLKMDELARMCLEVSERGEVRWHPERFERTYLDWLHGIRDWCVSRQLWLGHRIPVYTCPDGHQFAAVETPDVCRECGKGPLTEDPDVLDTWFSSALWPFATLGWPEKTDDLQAFYPTDLNVTDRGIINLWVTRMIFSGLEFMGEVPFKDVMINATIQAPDGRRMSKSLGTGIDPREIIRHHGADALRAWAAQAALSSQDVRFDESRIEGFRRFANKLWNATRLVVERLGTGPLPAVSPDADLALTDRWILSRLQATVEAVTDGIETYSFGTSIGAVYEFAWHDFCDWYLESIKARLADGDPAARSVALTVLDTVMRLLHPFMPFVSEELWHRLPGQRDFLVRTAWPEPDARFDAPEAEERVAWLQSIVEEVRSARKAARAAVRGGWLTFETPLPERDAELVSKLADVEIVPALEPAGVSLTAAAASVAFPASKGGDAGRERERERLRKELARTESKLANPDFLSKAPPPVVAKERAREAELTAALARLS